MRDFDPIVPTNLRSFGTVINNSGSTSGEIIVKMDR